MRRRCRRHGGRGCHDGGCHRTARRGSHTRRAPWARRRRRFSFDVDVFVYHPRTGRLLTGSAERDEKRGRGRSVYLGCASCFLSRPDHLERIERNREQVGTPGGCDSIHIFHRPTAPRRHTGLYCTVIPASGKLAAFLPVFRAAAGRVNSKQQPVRMRPTPTARRTTSSGVGAYETRGRLLRAHALTHAQAHRPSCRLTPNLGLSPAALGLVSTWLGWWRLGLGVRLGVR